MGQRPFLMITQMGREPTRPWRPDGRRVELPDPCRVTGRQPAKGRGHPALLLGGPAEGAGRGRETAARPGALPYPPASPFGTGAVGSFAIASARRRACSFDMPRVELRLSDLNKPCCDGFGFVPSATDRRIGSKPLEANGFFL